MEEVCIESLPLGGNLGKGMEGGGCSGGPATSVSGGPIAVIDFLRRDLLRGGTAIPACRWCFLIDGGDFERFCTSEGGEDRESNMDTGRCGLTGTGVDFDLGDAITDGDGGLDWDWRGRVRGCDISERAPTVDIADKLGRVEMGGVGIEGIAPGGVVEKVERLLPSWGWPLERGVGREKLGADGEGVRGIQYKLPSRSMIDSGLWEGGFSSIEERDRADRAREDRLFRVEDLSGLVSGETVGTLAPWVELRESLDPRRCSKRM